MSAENNPLSNGRPVNPHLSNFDDEDKPNYYFAIIDLIRSMNTESLQCCGAGLRLSINTRN